MVPFGEREDKQGRVKGLKLRSWVRGTLTLEWPWERQAQLSNRTSDPNIRSESWTTGVHVRIIGLHNSAWKPKLWVNRVKEPGCSERRGLEDAQRQHHHLRAIERQGNSQMKLRSHCGTGSQKSHRACCSRSPGKRAQGKDLRDFFYVWEQAQWAITPFHSRKEISAYLEFTGLKHVRLVHELHLWGNSREYLALGRCFCVLRVYMSALIRTLTLLCCHWHSFSKLKKKKKKIINQF